MMSVNRVAVMQMIKLAGKSSHRFLYLQHTGEDFASRQKTSLDFFSFRKDNPLVREINSEEVLKEFGQRAQRCFGCFVAYRLRDMYLGEDATFYCNYCKDDSMFHFDEFTKIIDLTKLREVADAE